MPLYEYYCPACHMIFSFLARTASVKTQPVCPRCGGELHKQVSAFSFSRKMKGVENMPVDSRQAEEGVKKLKHEIDRLKSEESPQRAEQFKKKFERWSGVQLDHSVGSLRGVELAPDKGASPEETDEPPRRDDTIYDLE